MDRPVARRSVNYARTLQPLCSDYNQSCAQHSVERRVVYPSWDLSPLIPHRARSFLAAGVMALADRLRAVCLSRIHSCLTRTGSTVRRRAVGWAAGSCDGDGDTKTLHGPDPSHGASGRILHVDGRRILGGQVLIRSLRHNLTLVVGKEGGSAGTPLPISGTVRVSRKGHAVAVVNQVDLENM